MTEENKNIYLFEVLPKEVLTFFLDSGLEDIDEIGKIYGMSKAAIDELDIIQQDILFGYVSLDSVENVIKERLGLDAGLARKVSLELIKRRFLPIDSYMGARAYSTYTNLGGRQVVNEIKRIDAAGGTVIDAKKALDREISNRLVERAKSKGAQEVEAKKEVSENVVTEAEHESSVNDSVFKESSVVTNKVAREHIVGAQIIKEPVANETITDEKILDSNEDIKKPTTGKASLKELAPPPPMVTDDTLPATKKDVGPMVLDTVSEDQVEVSGNPQNLTPEGELQKTQQDTTLSESGVAVEPQKDDHVKSNGTKIKNSTVQVSSRTDNFSKTLPKREVVVKPKKILHKKSNDFQGVTVEAGATVAIDGLKSTGAKAPYGLENARIDEVQRKLTLTFPSQELDKRFRVVLGARLSGVRSADDFKKALSGDIVKGGLGLDDRTISRILEEVEGKKLLEQQEASDRHKAEKDKMVRAAQVKYGSPSLSTARQGVSQQTTVVNKSGALQQKSKANPVLSEASHAPSVTSDGKRQIEDVTFKKRLVGPIDEFRRMNIDDFRRLPGDLDTAQENLMTDINTLGGEDPGLRIRAIEAWRHSPLVALYQRIMGAVLQSGKPVDEVLMDKSLNPKGMTKDELDAVRKMNTVLRY